MIPFDASIYNYSGETKLINKIKVGVLFGGKSAEHEVSLLSAKNVIEAMDPNKYEIVLIGISKTGEWFLHQDLHSCLSHSEDANLIRLKKTDENVALVPKEMGNPLVSLSGRSLHQAVDVVFPVLHGTYGEDGTIQGLLKLANIPFVGAGVLASAVGMDKDVMKRLLKEAEILTAKFLVYTPHSSKPLNFEYIKSELGLPFFVKPANSGSSVGISKIKDEAEFDEKVAIAFQYDHKILFEEYIEGREIECSVLGNDEPVASLPGEVIPQHEFYSYEAKYLDAEGALFEIPARLPETVIREIQRIAIHAYQVLCCEGMARVDVFLTKENKIVFNELNTIPGFTEISMYPKMWAASGLSYAALIDKLIQLALLRYAKEQSLRTTFQIEQKTAPSVLSLNETPYEC